MRFQGAIVAGLCVLVCWSQATAQNNIWNFGIDMHTYYRGAHKRSVAPITPLVIRLTYARQLNSQNTNLFVSVAHSIPFNATNFMEDKYVYLYEVLAFTGTIGLESTLLNSRMFYIGFYGGLTGRIGSIRRADIFLFLPPPPEYDEGILDNYRLDGTGISLGIRLAWKPFGSQKIALALSYGLTKYLLGIGAYHYSFNERVTLLSLSIYPSRE